MKTETLNLTNDATAYVAMPDNAAENTPAVIVVQEYWGLNDHIKDIAGRYAGEGFTAIAPDLYQGKIAANAEEAGKMMQSLEIEDGLEIIKNAMDAAREKYDISHFGITGFCMGGTYALRAACELEGISAAAPFYGDIPDEEILKKLTAPTVFISATKDKWINPEKVAGLIDIVETNELPVQSLKYEADHAFFNDTRPQVYDQAAAEDAWAKVVGFFKDNL